MATKTKTSKKAAKKSTAKKAAKKSRPSKRALGNRAEQIMATLKRMKEAELADIVAALNVKSEDRKFYASTILRMTRTKRVTRRSKGGVFVYRAGKAA